MMNKDQAQGQFEQIKGKLKEAWGKLTDDDIALYNGKRQQFLGKVQEKYGTVEAEADKQLRKLEDASRDNANKAA